MKFFTDYDIHKNSCIGITNLLTNITTKDHSHKGGWAKLLRCQLIEEGYKNTKIIDKNDRLDGFDLIIFDLGAEFSGVLNLFGGMNDKTTDRLLELHDFEGDMYSWQHNIPDIKILDKRRKNDSTCKRFKNLNKNFIFELNNKLLNINTDNVFNHVYRTNRILIGDSHTPSVWTSDYMIFRRDGRTLKGMLEHKTIDKIYNECKSHALMIDDIMVYAGNIDIRHHVLRQEDPVNYVIRLAKDLLMEIPYEVSGTICQLLPIENESRKLPKTGYFKGEAFKGSWAERSAAVEIFNRILINNEQGLEVYKHPKSFYNELGELTFNVMERPQSIHISPMHYRWDLDNNKPRY